MLVWNSSPKERSHKLTHFCFLKHQLAPPQGLGAVPFPNHFGTVKHKSWGVEAVEAESYDLGTRCKLLRVSARLFFLPSSFFFPFFFLFTTKIFLLALLFLFLLFSCISFFFSSPMHLSPPFFLFFVNYYHKQVALIRGN